MQEISNLISLFFFTPVLFKALSLKKVLTGPFFIWHIQIKYTFKPKKWWMLFQQTDHQQHFNFGFLDDKNTMGKNYFFRYLTHTNQSIPSNLH